MKDYKTVDGIPWEAFRKECNTDPGIDGYFSWSKGEEFISFRHKDSRITLKKDGTWSADCAPDWDGSS